MNKLSDLTQNVHAIESGVLSSLAHPASILCDLLEYSSERLQQFLELLGDEVQLRGWEQFRGGLDCKSKWVWSLAYMYNHQSTCFSRQRASTLNCVCNI